MRMRTVLHWAWFPWTTTTSFNVTTIPLIAVKFFTLFLCVCVCVLKILLFLKILLIFGGGGGGRFFYEGKASAGD